jgi:hypothetical protein
MAALMIIEGYTDSSPYCEYSFFKQKKRKGGEVVGVYLRRCRPLKGCLSPFADTGYSRLPTRMDRHEEGQKRAEKRSTYG